jgi:hypothetical protein
MWCSAYQKLDDHSHVPSTDLYTEHLSLHDQASKAKDYLWLAFSLGVFILHFSLFSPTHLVHIRHPVRVKLIEASGLHLQNLLLSNYKSDFIDLPPDGPLNHRTKVCRKASDVRFYNANSDQVSY